MQGPCSERLLPLEEVYVELLDGDTTLTFAAYNGHVNCVKEWLQTGVDVNVVNSYGETSLYTAAKMGRVMCVKVLLEAGADVNLVNNKKFTPFAVDDYESCVQLLVQRGADPHNAMCDESTALHWTAFRGYDTSTELLIHAGADVNKTTDHGVTPLMAAA